VSYSKACSWPPPASKQLLCNCDQLFAEAKHQTDLEHTRAIAVVAGTGMIDVIIADHQEVFRIGMAEVLGAADDIRIVAKPECPEQLLNTLTTANPHVLILSRNFLSGFSKIRRILKRRQSARLVLTEEDDPVAYVCWLPVQGILYRRIATLALVSPEIASCTV
jgi:hypothetical protein